MLVKTATNAAKKTSAKLTGRSLTLTNTRAHTRCVGQKALLLLYNRNYCDSLGLVALVANTVGIFLFEFFVLL